MLACRNTRPGVVQRWPTNRSPAVRSVRRWKPRSLTSKPGVVVADFSINKEGGNSNWGFALSTTTPGFEVNDLGSQRPPARRLTRQLGGAEDGGVRRQVD